MESDSATTEVERQLRNLGFVLPAERRGPRSDNFWKGIHGL